MTLPFARVARLVRVLRLVPMVGLIGLVRARQDSRDSRGSRGSQALGMALTLLAMLVTVPAFAQNGSTAGGQTGSGQTGGQTTTDPVTAAVDVTVIGLLPLPGVDVPATQVPAPVQVATDRDMTLSGAVDLSDFLNRNLNGVHINEVQNNPFQPDVNYRGYTASPLLGTPQGLSVYMDGVRLNQPFGEVVNWDLIPRIAIASTTLMPGSNPLFGLNTLGGALSVQTKDGRSFEGTTIQANVRTTTECTKT